MAKKKKIEEVSIGEVVDQGPIVGYYVYDSENADRVLDVLGSQLVLKHIVNSINKIEVSEAQANEIKVKYPYLVIEEKF